MKTIETTGTICFPSPSSTPIQGAKLYTKDEKLFIDFCHRDYPPQERYDIIIGIFNGLGQVTCVYNRYSGGTIIPIQTCKYRISYLFIGHHFNNLEEVLFNKVTIRLGSHFDWFNKRSIEIKFGTKPIIEFKENTGIAFNIDGFESVCFNFSYSVNLNGEKTVLNEEITLDAASKTLRCFKDFILVMVNIRHFFDLFTDIKFEINQITYQNYQIKQDRGGEIKNVPKSIELINPESENYPSPSSNFFYLQYSKIENQLPYILSRWCLQTKDNLAYNYLLEKSYNKNLSSKTYFINMCFAVEIYSKNHSENKVLENDKFLQIKKYLLNVVKDSDALTWLKKKFSLGNNPSFKDRLLEFKAELDYIVSGDSSKLISKIVNSRNYFAHSSYSQRIIKTEIEYYITALTMEVLLKVLILSNLGASSDVIMVLKSDAQKAISDFKNINEYIDSE